MRFGKTKKEKATKDADYIYGVEKFAFPLPAEMVDGTKVWCETYYEYRDGFVNKDGNYQLYYTILPGYHSSPTVSYPIPRRYYEKDASFIKIYPNGPEDLMIPIPPGNEDGSSESLPRSMKPDSSDDVGKAKSVERLKKTLSGVYFPPDK